MDLRVYYRKIRDVEVTLTEAYVVLVSLTTPDGGKAGVFTEAARHVAAKQIAEGRARLATEEEASEYHAHVLRRRQEQDEVERLNRLQVVLVPPKSQGKVVKE